jgi:hypothetical protein
MCASEEISLPSTNIHALSVVLTDEASDSKDGLSLWVAVSKCQDYKLSQRNIGGLDWLLILRI